MLRLPKNGPCRKKSYLKPGTYMSTVISAEEAPGYATGQAVLVTYRLKGPSGESFDFKETFRVKSPLGEHSEDFFQYLEDNGIADWEQFVDREEEVTLSYEFKGKKRYLNITERRFL